jgi:2-haloacid dehalogenase
MAHETDAALRVRTITIFGSLTCAAKTSASREQPSCRSVRFAVSLSSEEIDMNVARRSLLALTVGALAAPRLFAEPTAPRWRAIAFDGLVVFDTRRVQTLAEERFPGRGAALVTAWRSRQFEYQWLRTTGEQYADFLTVTSDSLEFAVRSLNLELSAETRAALMEVYVTLDVWPDARPALHALRESGMQLAFLSNMTATMLSDGLARADLGGLFSHVLSTDAVSAFKPAPRAYSLGPTMLGLPKESILFVASAGWDAAGARWFGYPTYWVNRSAAPPESLGLSADAAGPDLSSLVRYVGEHSTNRRA